MRPSMIVISKLTDVGNGAFHYDLRLKKKLFRNPRSIRLPGAGSNLNKWPGQKPAP